LKDAESDASRSIQGADSASRSSRRNSLNHRFPPGFLNEKPEKSTLPGNSTRLRLL